MSTKGKQSSQISKNITRKKIIGGAPSFAKCNKLSKKLIDLVHQITIKYKFNEDDENELKNQFDKLNNSEIVEPNDLNSIRKSLLDGGTFERKTSILDRQFYKEKAEYLSFGKHRQARREFQKATKVIIKILTKVVDKIKQISKKFVGKSLSQLDIMANELYNSSSLINIEIQKQYNQDKEDEVREAAGVDDGENGEGSDD